MIRQLSVRESIEAALKKLQVPMRLIGLQSC
jgi:hypothetical protein